MYQKLSVMMFFVPFLLAHYGPASAAVPQHRIVSWNAYSVQFIDPPELTLLAIPRTVVYRAVVEQGGKSWQVDSARPQVSLASVWGQMQTRKFILTLDYGCVSHWYSDLQVMPTFETITKFMYPITPVELHEGYIVGKERILANRSGLFGWGDASKHEVHVFDDTGREVPDFKAPTVERGGATFTELRIAEGWSAAIVRKTGK